MYVMTDENGRILATSEEYHLGENETVFDFPEGFDFSRQADFRIVRRKLIHDPLPVPKPPKNPIEALGEENQLLTAQVKALDEREEFLEECLAELVTLMLSDNE